MYFSKSTAFKQVATETRQQKAFKKCLQTGRHRDAPTEGIQKMMTERP